MEWNYSSIPNFNGTTVEVWEWISNFISYIINDVNSSMLGLKLIYVSSLHWRHNDQDGVSNHQPHGCLLNRLFRRRSKKTSKLRVTGLCVGNSPGPVNSPHKGPVTRKMFPFDDVIMVKGAPGRYPQRDMLRLQFINMQFTSLSCHVPYLNLCFWNH